MQDLLHVLFTRVTAIGNRLYTRLLNEVQYIAKNGNLADSISEWSYPRPPFARCLASQSWHPGVWLNSMNMRLTKAARVEEMRIVDIKSLINSMGDSLLKVLPNSL